MPGHKIPLKTRPATEEMCTNVYNKKTLCDQNTDVKVRTRIRSKVFTLIITVQGEAVSVRSTLFLETQIDQIIISEPNMSVRDRRTE